MTGRRTLTTALRLVLAMAGLSPVLSCLAASDDYLGMKPDYGRETATWQEGEVRLPPLPKPENLLPVHPAARDALKLSVERESVNVSDEGIVRLVVVLESATGARNVFFDGYRCGEREYKTYAYVDAAGRWASVRNAQWQKLPRGESGAYRRDLYSDYLCAGGAPGSAREVIQRLNRPD